MFEASIHEIGLPWWLVNPPASEGEVGLILGLGRFPWRRKWQPTPVFLPGKSQEQRSLVGYSPWGCKRVGHDLETKQQQQINVIIHPTPFSQTFTLLLPPYIPILFWHFSLFFLFFTFPRSLPLALNTKIKWWGFTFLFSSLRPITQTTNLTWHSSPCNSSSCKLWLYRPGVCSFQGCFHLGDNINT